MKRYRDVVLLRVSSDEQAGDERLSLATQDARCRAASATTGGEVLRVFQEEQTSWVDELEKRPVLQEAIRYAVAEKADRFWVYRFDRFARNKYIFFTADHLLQRAGVTLLSTIEHHEPGTPTGELLKGVHALLAEAESAKKSEVVRDNLRQKALSGRWVGRRPYGYCKGTCHICVEETGPDCPRHGQPERPERWRTVPDPLSGQTISIPVMVPRPDEALGYALMVRLAREGVETYREIAHVLNAAGYRSTQGGPWRGDTVRLTLTSPAYLGHVVLRSGDGPATRAAYPGLHQPLLDKEVWEEVQERCRRLANGQAGRHRAREPYVLSGLIYCARCGARLSGMRSTRPAGDSRYYICGCRNKLGAEGCDLPLLRATVLEERVAQLLDELVLPPQWRDEILAETRAPRPAGPTAADLEAEEARLVQMYQDGFVAYPDFKARWDGVQERKRRARPPTPQAVLDLGEILERGIGQLFRQAPDVAARRRLLHALFERLVIAGETSTEPVIEEVAWQKAAEPLTRWFSTTSRSSRRTQPTTAAA